MTVGARKAARGPRSEIAFLAGAHHMAAMSSYLRPLMAVFVALLLAGCGTSRFVAEVTQFHELQPGETRSFVVMAADPAKADRLEFKAYARAVAGELEREGFRAAGASQENDLVVLLDYAVGPAEVRSYPVPVYGYYPDRTMHISGIRRGDQRYSAHIYESGGMVPLGYTEMTEVTYTTYMTLDIVDAAAWRQGRSEKKYEGRVSRHGPDNNIAAVMPLMIQALFADFPGNNGTTQTVILEPES